MTITWGEPPARLRKRSTPETARRGGRGEPKVARRSDRPARPPRLTFGRSGPSSPTPMPPLGSDSTRRRSTIVIAVTMVFVAFLASVLVKVQVVDAGRYVAHGLSQRTDHINLPGLRGSVTDRNGDPLAVSLAVKAVVANPRKITDPDAVAAALSPVLGIGIEELVGDLSRADTGFAYLARGVDPNLAQQALEAVPESQREGVFLTDEVTRVNAADDLALALVGRVERGSGTALWGIEKRYDELLRGKNGEATREMGRDGSTIVGSERTTREPAPGESIRLTIDKALQYMAETVLQRQLLAVGASAGTVIVGRPSTGEVLAMANAAVVDGVAQPARLNVATRAYEPGSVMKMVTAAGVFEEGIYTPESVIGAVADKIKLYDRTIHDAESHETKDMSVSQIVAHSSNVGTIRLAQELGKDRLVRYLHAFGFGKMTSLGLPKEQAGVVKEDWNGTDIGSIPIGQSITVTPLQIWAAYNTIANGGIYVAPRVVADVVDASGRRRTPAIPDSRRVVSEATAGEVTRVLHDVIDEGTGKDFAIDGFNIAAKTGTAYEPVPGGGYGSGGNRHYAATFTGYFPASDPQISITVMIDDPQYPNHFGSVAAGPVFDELAREAVRRFGIVGDAQPVSEDKPLRSRPAPAPTTTTTLPIAPAVEPAAPEEPANQAPVPANG